jgi:Subtilisin inhibitor-like
MRSSLRTFVALATAVACSLIATPANAEPATSIVITKQGPGIDPVTGLLPKLMTRECDPTGGTHPHRDDACAVLAQAHGDFNRIKPLKRVCTMDYNPVRATAHGTWYGRPVDWVADFPNDCEAGSQTDLVFEF